MDAGCKWFGYYEDMVKLPNDCWDADYRIFESAKDFAKWCICIANADQNLSYYVKHVLLNFGQIRSQPTVSYVGKFKRKSRKRWSGAKTFGSP